MATPCGCPRLEESPQAGEVGKEESQEVQQGGGQSPAHGEKQ